MATDVSEILALGAHLTTVSGTMRAKASQIVTKTAHDVQARAQQVAPVDTGALRASITTSSSGDLAAEVGPTVNYGKYVEFGTYKMSPKPYLKPALDAVTPGFVAACKQLGAA